MKKAGNNPRWPGSAVDHIFSTKTKANTHMVTGTTETKFLTQAHLAQVTAKFTPNCSSETTKPWS